MKPTVHCKDWIEFCDHTSPQNLGKSNAIENDFHSTGKLKPVVFTRHYTIHWPTNVSIIHRKQLPYRNMDFNNISMGKTWFEIEIKQSRYVYIYIYIFV